MDNRNKRRTEKIIIGLLLLAYAIVLLRNAWIGDDAFITFRTIDNFVNGFGLRWNISERVQTYTHPLWMMLLTVFYAFTREAFYTGMFVSVVSSVAALAIFAFRTAKSTILACLGILALMLSKSFVDYSTSGLENPLSHLIFILFFTALFKYDGSVRSLGILSLIAGLGTLNRMDNIIFLSPILVYLFVKNRSYRAAGIMIAGFIPFIVWEAFSLFYYGFPFPNTAYAKLNTGIPWTDLVGQGFHYIVNSLTFDPLTMILILIGFSVPFFAGRRLHMAISFGILLYIIYVIRIGGCFMSGRLLAAPFLCAVILLSQSDLRLGKKWIFLPTALILIFGLISDYSPIYTTSQYGGENERYRFGHGIVDERGWYFQSSSLLNIHPDVEMPNHRFAEIGRNTESAAIMTLIIGYLGYYAPRETHIVDRYALGDPLLARLPVQLDQSWRIGHFERRMPFGYGETIGSGINQINDSSLAEYYKRLSQITRGNLFEWDRIITIISFNFGAYDHLIDNYWRGR